MKAMAKFQSRHSRQKHSVFSGSIRLILLGAIALIVIVFFLPEVKGLLGGSQPAATSFTSTSDRFYLPQELTYPVHHKKHYSLAYAEEHEQAAWVAYELNVDHLNAKKVGRSDYFKDDVSIASGSAVFADYKNSGYTKGHMVPAADRAYSIESMEETFLMSNMSPQVYHCNGGIWRELEEQVRDWARYNKSVYIVSGPVFTRGMKRIGRNRVAVPETYFKVVLDLTEPEQKGIGFLIPNAKSEKHLRECAVSIDQIEELIDLDLFHQLMPESLENDVESKIDLAKWRFDDRRYERRVEKWNR